MNIPFSRISNCRNTEERTINDSLLIKDCQATLTGLGDSETKAAENMFPAVYTELRHIAAGRMKREHGAQVLQPTALVNEVYMKLAGQKEAKINSKTHFIAIASVAMQRILCDHARARNTQKRGGERKREYIDDVEGKEYENEMAEAMALSLERLSEFDARKAAVVRLRFLGGLNTVQIAETLGVARSTVDADWAAAKDWIREDLRS